MSKEELLEKARGNYKIGTKFISDYGLEKGTKAEWVIDSDEFVEFNSGIQGTSNNCTPYVYYNGNWAKIISTPNSKLNLNYLIL